MDRTEPRLDPDLQGLKFRTPPRWAEPATDGRFSMAIAVFLLVALAYPWYSYWVQTHLLARDIRQGVEEFSKSMDEELGKASSQLEAQKQVSAEQTARRRLAGVRVNGISDGRPPLAVVDLGQSSFPEADETVCRQAGMWLRRSVSGTVIRVQSVRSRGTSLAFTELACP